MSFEADQARDRCVCQGVHRREAERVVSGRTPRIPRHLLDCGATGGVTVHLRRVTVDGDDEYTIAFRFPQIITTNEFSRIRRGLDVAESIADGFALNLRHELAPDPDDEWD